MHMQVHPFTSRPARESNPHFFSPELALALEQIEVDVWGDLYRLATPEEGAGLGLHVSKHASATVFAASGLDVLGFNRVVGLGVTVPATEAHLDAVIARYEAAGVRRFFVQVSPAAMPPALFDWLRARGFVHYNNWVKLVRGVEHPPEVETGLRIEEIGMERAETFGLIVAAGFGWPSLVQRLLVRFVGRPGWRHYLAYEGTTPVAAAGLYVDGAYGYLGPAATLSAYRGRGAQQALIARRIRDAAALDCSALVTETAEDRPGREAPSFRNMRRAGFEVAYLRPNYLVSLPRAGYVKVE